MWNVRERGAEDDAQVFSPKMTGRTQVPLIETRGGVPTACTALVCTHTSTPIYTCASHHQRGTDTRYVPGPCGNRGRQRSRGHSPTPSITRGVCSQRASSRRWTKLWAMRLKHRVTQHHSWKRLPAGREVRGEYVGQLLILKLEIRTGV